MRFEYIIHKLNTANYLRVLEVCHTKINDTQMDMIDDKDL